jgi:hypothetical protein
MGAPVVLETVPYHFYLLRRRLSTSAVIPDLSEARYG